MNIKLHYECNNFTAPFEVEITVKSNEVYYQKTHTVHESGFFELYCDFPNNVATELSVGCRDSVITESNITITVMELDDFYKLDTYVYGRNEHYVDQEKYFEVNDNNCLFFIGAIVYTLLRPLPGMLFGRRFKLATPV